MSVDRDSDDPAVGRAADALSAALVERFIDRIRGFEVARSQFPEEIRDVTGVLQSAVFATPAELRQLRAEILALMSRYADRLDPKLRPAGSQPFELVMFVHVLNTVG